jgi:hypothetical protein
MKTTFMMKSLYLASVILLASIIFSTSAVAGTQVVMISPAEIAVAAGQSGQLDVVYEVMAGSGKTTGLGLRIHYNSSMIKAIALDSTYGEGLIAVDTAPRDDIGNADGDASTDKYIGVAWIGVAGDWPSFMPLPLLLGKLVVTVRTDCLPGMSAINLSTSGTPEGYTFQGKGAIVRIP